MCWSCHCKVWSSQTNDYVMISLLPIIIKCPIFLFLTSLLQTKIRFHQRRSCIGNKRHGSFTTKTLTGKWTAALKWSGTSADCSQMKQDNSIVTTKRKKQFNHFNISRVSLVALLLLVCRFLWILNFGHLASEADFCIPLANDFSRSWRNHILLGHERPEKLRVVSK